MQQVTFDASNAESDSGDFAEIKIDELELREDLLGGLFSCCPFLPCSPYPMNET